MASMDRLQTRQDVEEQLMAVAAKATALQLRLEECRSEGKFLKRRLRRMHLEALAEKHGPEPGVEDDLAESAEGDARGAKRDSVCVAPESIGDDGVRRDSDGAVPGVVVGGGRVKRAKGSGIVFCHV